MNILENKERFISIYKQFIKREGADRLLDYLCASDFFSAPASTRFHGSYPGGLCEHSLNVYDCLKDIQSQIPAHLLSEETKYYINPTGRFEIGGPKGDCVLV